MRRLIHWLAHKLGRNTGYVTTWWQGDKLMVGFRCDGCCKVSGAHESFTSIRHSLRKLRSNSDITGWTR